MIERSGNHLVDNEDDDEEREIKSKKNLPCGCVNRCKCDEERFYDD